MYTGRVTLHLAHFLKLFRPPLCHLHRYIHVVTTDIYLHISGYPSARGILCACVFLVKIMFIVCTIGRGGLVVLENLPTMLLIQLSNSLFIVQSIPHKW